MSSISPSIFYDCESQSVRLPGKSESGSVGPFDSSSFLAGKSL